jgi:prevent-host-death family protein
MTITTFSSREFNHDASKAKKAANNGPVFITDRGRPAHVLLSIADYRKLTGESASIVDLLAATSTAATALVHGMTVVTRNVANFEATGVSILNPWL